MDLVELKETTVWDLYQKGKNYLGMMNVYTDTDKNFRMYNGNQNEGIKIESIEPIQLNFIKPIVKYKVAVINQNLWGIVYEPDNFEDDEFKDTASQICKLLNQKASNTWEKNRMDRKIKRLSKNAAINDEAPIYITYNDKDKIPELEIISKNDIYYGDENNDDIQDQPYILIRQRKTVIEAQQMAKDAGVNKADLDRIIGDNQTFNESGDAAKYEVDDKVTVITKFYKQNGQVYYTQSTQYVDIVKDKNSQLTRYPIAHMIWEEKEGSARGEGEVRGLIANQLEVNKTLMRRALVTKITAYPQKIANIDMIQNPAAINTVGGTIKIHGSQVDDVKKMFSFTQPAQMSTDVQQLQQDLIETTRNLANAGEIATGSVNPDTASGKAILAVQNASQQPLTDQMEELKDFIEQIALIWLDMLIVYNPEGLNMVDITKDANGNDVANIIKVEGTSLQKLKASVKIDITPKSAYDQYARELSLENLLKAGFFSAQRMSELELYANALPDDSTMPKQILLELLKKEREKQAYIAQVDAQTQQMMQRANQFMGSDPDAQASMINEAQQQVQQQSQQGQTAQQILPTVNKQQDIDTINKRLAILKNAVSKYKAK